MSFSIYFKRIARDNAFVAASCLTFSTCNLVLGLAIECSGLKLTNQAQAYTHHLSRNSCLAIVSAIPWVLTANRLKKASEALSESSEPLRTFRHPQAVDSIKPSTSLDLVSLNIKYHPHDLN